jgi:hypothetical protein
MMTDKQFDAFVAQAVRALEQKQDLLTDTYGLGKYEEFWFDQSTGVLQFKDATGCVQSEATVTPIGSYSQKSRTWQWAWANDSLAEMLRKKAEELKLLYDLTGFEVFQTSVFKADEQMAWELAAMAVHQLGSLGCYRIPTGRLHVFLSIDQVTKIA